MRKKQLDAPTVVIQPFLLIGSRRANYLGVNGVALAAGCSLIAGLGGFSVSKLRGGKKNDNTRGKGNSRKAS